MTHTEKLIVVDVPLRMAYDQRTQFESLPSFMKGNLATGAWRGEIRRGQVAWT